MSLNYALIGAGRISPNHIEAAKENGLNIVAICDLNPSKLNELINKTNFESSVRFYSDYKAMIDEENLDLIAIATDSGSHFKIAEYCLDRGIHLIIEKPIALSLEHADRIIDLAKQKNLVVSPSHQNRFNKSIQKIKETMDDNKFGRLYHATANVRWNRNKEYYNKDDWRGTWSHDGGALMNQSIHNIDLIRWLMGGEIDEVYGQIDNLAHDNIEVEDLGMALIKFKNGSYGIIEATTNVFPTNFEETLYLFGENATVKVGGKSVNIIEEWLVKNDLESADDVKMKYQENPPNVYGFGHIPLYKDVISAIIDKRSPYITAQDGRDALELVLAIYLSSKEKRPVKLPLENTSTDIMK